jgi:autotransporter-associated beta strand protein
LGLLATIGGLLALADGAGAQPVITNQPANQGTCVGSAATFSVGASGNSLTYQWQLSTDNGTTFNDIGGANVASYTTPATTLADNGKQYQVIVTDVSSLSVTSTPPAVLAVFSGPPAVYAGPNQVINTNLIQLAGSVGNAAGAVWSGGLGTFSPNAQTTNALYTPSATEMAAGSWALTLTASSPCGTATSTMSFSVAPAPLTLQVITSQSYAGIDLCLNPESLGSVCSGSTNSLTGYMVVQLDTNGQPTQISLQDYNLAATGPYHLSYSWLAGLQTLSITVTNVDMADGAPGPENPFYPVYNGNEVIITNLPCQSTGGGAYSLGGLVSTNGILDLDSNGIITNTTTPATINVTNGVATLRLSFTVTDTIDVTNLLATYTLTSTVVATNAIPAYSRALVWNNGAGTGNWNTNDLNWNRGTALWRNTYELDSAVFGADGIGTVTLTKPITAGGLDFESPGYTIAGSSLNSLALSGPSAITNNAAATISGVIASGALNKWGGSLLTLSGANTYSGGTWVNAGTLQITNDGQLGAVPASPALNLTLNGGQLFNNAASLSLAANRTVSLGAGGGYLEAGGAGNTFTVNGQITGAGGLGVAWDSGTVVLNGANNYAGATTIGTTGNACNNNAGATLRLGNASALPATDLIFGSSAHTATLDLHGYSATVGALTGGANAVVDNLSGGTSTVSVGNNGAGSTFSGVIQNTAGTVSLAKIGSGTVTLAGGNTYSGNTIISAGMLALGSGGSLGGGSSVSIAAGATLDVSALGGSYSLGSSATLTASGTASPATINGLSGGTMNLGAQPIVLNYDGAHPALTVAQSTLNLNGNTISVDAPSALGEGTYPLIQVTGGGAIVINGSLTLSGTAVVRGYAGTFSVSGNELMLTVVRSLASSTTTMGPFAPSQTYGSVIVGATVSPTNATGTVVFYSGGIAVATNTLDGVTGVATGPAVPSLLPVGSHAISATYGGDFYYAGSSSSGSSNLIVTIATVTLAGSKTYDKTAVITPATGLTISPNYDGANVYLTPTNGIVYLAGYNAGSQAITSVLLTNGPTTVTNHSLIPANANQITTNTFLNYNTPTRVQSANATAGSSPITVTLANTPANGNTLIAVVATMSTSATAATVSSSGATWTRAASAAETGAPPLGLDGAEIEIWYATNLQSASKTVSISLPSSTAGAAVVMEYSGVLTASPLDKTASNKNDNSSPLTGTTATTTQANELWIGAIGVQGSSTTFSSPQNGFTVYNSVQNYEWYNLISQYYLSAYALDSVVTATGGAYTGGTLGTGTYWSGAIATFKASSYYTYTYTYYTTNISVTLAGPEATNYTLVYSGTVTINPYPITVVATAASKTYDGTTTAAGNATITPSGGVLIGGDTYTPTSLGQAFSSRTSAVGTAVIVPGTITSISDGNGGNNYSVTYSNYTAGTINPKALTLLGLSAQSRAYDGTNTATLSATAAFITPFDAPGGGTTTDGTPYTVDPGVAPGNHATGTFATSFVGTNKAVTSYVTVTGTGSGNYTVTQPGLLANITNLVVELTGSKTYDGTTTVPAGDLSVANNYDGTNLTLSGSATLTSRNAGGPIALLDIARLTLGGSMATNYTLTDATGSLTVAATNLEVTAAADLKLYDGTTSSAATPTITVGGIQPGDTAPAWTESYDTRNVGTGLTLTVAPQPVNDGNSGANYNVSYGTSSLGEIDQTNLAVTAAPNTKTYDGTTSALATPTITVGGIQTGDSAPMWTETYTDQNVGTGKTLTPAALTVSDGNGGANYSYNYVAEAVGEIDALSTTTSLAVDINPSGLTTNVTFTATVAGVLPTVGSPSGYVVFVANSTPFATNGPLVSGSITASTASLPAGTNAVSAQYLGDGNYLASANIPPLAQVVTNNVIYSQTNSITSIVNHHDGTFTLNFTGTPGAQYYVVANGSIKAQIVNWIPVAGTTNITATSPSGTWSCVVSNPAPAYYRPVAVNPAP